MTMDFKVSFKNKLIPLNQWPQMKTIAELKQHLESETELPIACQKLLWKGRVLQNEQRLGDIAIPDNAKIMLIGSQPKQVQAIAKLDEQLAERHTFAPRLSSKKLTRPRPAAAAAAEKYTFHRITVLDKFPQQENARKLLERLRDDRGVSFPIYL